MLKTNMTKMNWKVLLTRWIIAGSLLLALLTKSIDAKAAITESRFSELATPPTMMGVAQSSIPDYIAQAKAAVKKYYPQYENYFNSIFEELKVLEQEDKNFFNKIIHKDLDLFSIDIKTEKDKWTTILIFLEKFELKKSFQEAKDVQIIDQSQWYDLRESIACEIEDEINKFMIEKEQKLNYINWIIYEIDKRVDKLLKNEISRNEKEEMIDLIEALFLLTADTEEIRKNLDPVIKLYIDLTKEINRNPNELWKKFIREYNK